MVKFTRDILAGIIIFYILIFGGVAVMQYIGYENMVAFTGKISATFSICVINCPPELTDNVSVNQSEAYTDDILECLEGSYSDENTTSPTGDGIMTIFCL